MTESSDIQTGDPRVASVVEIMQRHGLGLTSLTENDGPGDMWTAATEIVNRVDGRRYWFTLRPDGAMLPSIPEPLWIGWRLRKAQCECGVVSANVERYKEHYSWTHLVKGEMPYRLSIK